MTLSSLPARPNLEAGSDRFLMHRDTMLEHSECIAESILKLDRAERQEPTAEEPPVDDQAPS